MTTKHYAFLLFLFLNITYLFGQTLDSTSTTIVDNFNAFSNSRAFDNIYIQTNKDIYETEEDLWFKAYILDAHYFLPSLRSNVLFVQLINNVSKNVVWEEKYEIENGFVYGHVYIPSDIEFYASDIYGNFTGTIEGIGGDGLLGSEGFEFIIRK